MPKRSSFRRTFFHCQRSVRLSLQILTALGLALGLGSIVPTRWHYSKPIDCTYPVFVSSVNHFHAELILPVTTPAFDWRSHLNLAQLGERWTTYRYLSFGWGDRQFFMGGSLDPLSVLDALLVPGDATLHVWGHSENPARLAPTFAVKQIRLSQAEYLKLAQFVQKSFRRTAFGTVQYIQPGLYPESGFYEATGTYSMVKTCNSWTAEGLQQAGVNTPIWAALAPAVMEQLRSNCGVAKTKRGGS